MLVVEMKSNHKSYSRYVNVYVLIVMKKPEKNNKEKVLKLMRTILNEHFF